MGSDILSIFRHSHRKQMKNLMRLVLAEISNYSQEGDRILILLELLGISIELLDWIVETIRTEECKQEF